MVQELCVAFKGHEGEENEFATMLGTMPNLETLDLVSWSEEAGSLILDALKRSPNVLPKLKSVHATQVEWFYPAFDPRRNRHLLSYPLLDKPHAERNGIFLGPSQRGRLIPTYFTTLNQGIND